MRRDTRTVDFLEVPQVFATADGNWDFALEVVARLSVLRNEIDRIIGDLNQLVGPGHA